VVTPPGLRHLVDRHLTAEGPQSPPLYLLVVEHAPGVRLRRVADPPPPLGNPLQSGLDEVLGLVTVAGQQVRGAEQRGGRAVTNRPNSTSASASIPASSSPEKTGTAARHDATRPWKATPRRRGRSDAADAV